MEFVLTARELARFLIGTLFVLESPDPPNLLISQARLTGDLGALFYRGLGRPRLVAAGAFYVLRGNARAGMELAVSASAQVNCGEMDKSAKVWRSARVAEVCFQ